jgi:hypothetical protein
MLTADNRFLLHYKARDEVDLLEKGDNGVDEMREAAKRYCEKEDNPKPLFGLVQFKRRKVLIKLVVDGTSRLIQGECCLMILCARLTSFA